MFPRSNQNKIPMLGELALDGNTDIIALSETHLSGDILDVELNMKNFTLYRADRKERSHGGVALYIKNELATDLEVLTKFSNKTTELLSVHIKKLDLVIINVYRPPNTSATDFRDVLDHIKTTVNNLPKPTTEILLMGDFNLPHICWQTMNVIGGSAQDRWQAEEFLSIIKDSCLSQFIRDPTRGRNILDLLLSNSPNIVHSYELTDTALTDHRLLTVKAAINSTMRKENRTLRMGSACTSMTLSNLNFYCDTIDWDSVKTDLQLIDWNQALGVGNSGDMLVTLQEKCKEICEKHLPQKTHTNNRNRSHIPRDRRILMRRRRNLQKKLRTEYRPFEQIKLEKGIKDIDTKLLQSHEEQRIREERRAVDNIKSNSKYFFSYAKRKFKNMETVGPLVDESGKLVDNPREMAQILKEQYESVFSTPDCNMVVADPTLFFTDLPGSRTHRLSSITVSEEDIITAINKIAPDSAAGPDGFHAQLIKKCKHELATPLQILYSSQLQAGVVPDLLKVGLVTPIFKGGNKGLAKNYRPVVLTSHLIKILERIIRAKMVEYFERIKAFNNGQHGFRRGRSCLSQLLAHYENILEGIKEGHNVDVIYLDFAKAFDKVDHGILLHKLRNLGICGKLGEWLHSFLTGRVQHVILQGTLSEPSPVTSGVPQGSVLGPLLFLIMVGDIDSDVQRATVTSFADDTRILKTISSVNDVNALQADLDRVINWAERNNMALNGEKFEVIRYGRLEDIKTSTQYHCHQQIIESKNQVKDLGIHMSEDGTFSCHLDKILEGARKLTGWILRTFQTRTPECMLTLWKSLVLPRLEYCCQLWSPYKTGDIIKLEAIQRSFTNKISGMENLNYWERLSKLGLYSLQRRRERYIVLYVWKTLEGMVPNVGLHPNHHPRRGRLCYVRRADGASQRVKTLIFNSYTFSGTRLFNSIPPKLRNLTNTGADTFKRQLDKWLSKVLDLPPMPGYTCSTHNSLLEQTGGSRGPPWLG